MISIRSNIADKLSIKISFAFKKNENNNEGVIYLVFSGYKNIRYFEQRLLDDRGTRDIITDVDFMVCWDSPADIASIKGRGISNIANNSYFRRWLGNDLQLNVIKTDGFNPGETIATITKKRA